MASQEIVIRLVGEGQSVIGGQASNPASGILGKIGKGMGGAAGALTFAGIGGLIAAIDKVKDILKKIYNQMVESSNILKGTMEIHKLTWKLIWKPISDFFGRLLKPLVTLLLKWVVNDIKEINNRGAFYAGIKKIAEETGKKEGPLAGMASNLLGGIAAIGETGLLPTSIGFLASMLVASIHDLALSIEDIFVDVPAEDYISSSIVGLYIGIADSIKKSFKPGQFTTPGTWENVKNKLIVDYEKSTTATGEVVTEQMKKDLLGDLYIEPIKNLNSYFKDTGEQIFTDLETGLTKTKSEITKVKNNTPLQISANIKTPISDTFGVVKTKVTSVKNNIPSQMTSKVANPVNDLFSAIGSLISKVKRAVDQAKRAIDSYRSNTTFGRLNLNVPDNSVKAPYAINDAIITKNGKIIKTNSKDNLIATQGGIAGTKIDNMNITVTVQQLNSDRDLRDLANKLSEYIQRRTTYRTSGGY